jgi:integrase
MPTLFDDGFHRLYVRHIYLRGQVWYFRRRYPEDLKHRFGGRATKRISLGTESKPEAVKKAREMLARDEASYALMRNPEASHTPVDLTRAAISVLDRLGVTPCPSDSESERERKSVELHEHFSQKYMNRQEADRNPYTGETPSVARYFNELDREVVRAYKGEPAEKRLSDALVHYLTNHSKGQQRKFKNDTTYKIQTVIDTVGDMPLQDYRRHHAESVRDFSLSTGVTTATVRRNNNTISVVFDDGNLAFDLRLPSNPFQKLPIKNEGKDEKPRIPFTSDELISLAEAIRLTDDDRRYILGLQINTGARLGEITGLRLSDVVLDHAVPHIVITPHDLRGTKTDNTRRVPLVGVSLWSAERAVSNSKNQDFLFPRYVNLTAKSGEQNRANSASATLNKWIKRTIGSSEKTTHCFRHALIDRLRAVEAPMELSDEITGHATPVVGRSYGTGHRLEHMREYLEKIAI